MNVDVMRKFTFYTVTGLLLVIIVEVLFTGIILVQDNYYSSGHITISLIRDKLREHCDPETEPYFMAQPNLTFVNNPAKEVGGISLVNSHGYRGVALPLEQDNERVRVLFLGESTTFGFGVADYHDAFPHIVDSLFSGSVEVLNGGLLAATSAEVLSHYLFKYRYYKSDIVVVKLGMNELNRYLVSDSFQPDYTHHRNIHFDFPRIPESGKILLRSTFLSWVIINTFYLPRYNYGFALENEGNPFAKFIRWFPESLNIDSLYHAGDFKLSPYYMNLMTLINTAKMDDAKVVLLSNIYNPDFSDDENVDWRHYKDYCALYNNIMAQIAISEDVNLIDLRELNIPQSSWIDDCHLNEFGHGVIAPMVARGLRGLVLPVNEEPFRQNMSDTALIKPREISVP